MARCPVNRVKVDFEKVVNSSFQAELWNFFVCLFFALSTSHCRGSSVCIYLDGELLKNVAFLHSAGVCCVCVCSLVTVRLFDTLLLLILKNDLGEYKK